MGKNVDLSGRRFGKLFILGKSNRKGKNSYWICRCDCGVEKEICATALRHGQKSCGCEKPIKETIKNDYFLDENKVVHVILRSNDEMLCNLEDWNEYKHLTWTKDKWGYARAHKNRENVKFHVQIMGKKDGYVIDHIDRNKLNNQRNNLRFLTPTGNAVNTGLRKNNKSGITGVSKYRNKWHASIMVQGKNIHLGYYDRIEDAKEARIRAEEKYFSPLFKTE